MVYHRDVGILTVGVKSDECPLTDVIYYLPCSR
jgi:hypothetical protein